MTSRTRLWPLRHAVTRFVNPITRIVAGGLPGFGVLTYPGRTTGRIYHTPVNVFRRGDDYVFVLTYGSDAAWVKNVVAAGGCTIRSRGRDIRLSNPELVIDPSRGLVPAPIRFIGRLGNVTQFLRMQPEAGSTRPRRTDAKAA